MFDVSAAYAESLKGNGTGYLSDFELMELVGFAAAKSAVVQSVEAFRIDSDGDLPMIEYSMLGLERESEWGATDDWKVASSLVRQKVDAARSETNPMKYKAWVRSTEI